MNDSEKEEINGGNKFHLPNGFNADPARYCRQRQLDLLTEQERIIQAMKDHALRQKPKHQGPEK